MENVRGEVNRYGLSLTIPVCHNLVCSPRFTNPRNIPSPYSSRHSLPSCGPLRGPKGTRRG